VPIVGLLKTNTYRDSVALMVLTAALGERDGVEQASAMMATPANLEILRATGLFAEAFVDAGPNDLCVAVDAQDVAAADAALAEVERLLSTGQRSSSASGGAGALDGDPWRPRSLTSAIRARPDANLALISVPGDRATHEARLALLAGLHVFLFSDNVAIEDEVALKRLASERDLLMMGPDCGTALIGGAPLGFANAVRRGPVGVVGSSGTGLQEVTSLIHRLGGGVSHAIGTGGRDLYGPVGGLTFLAAADALAADADTRVVVAIAKPGDPAVEQRVLERLAASGKPTVVYFLGGSTSPSPQPSPRGRGRTGSPLPRSGGGDGGGGQSGVTGSHFIVAHDLEHAARCAVALANGEPPPPSDEYGALDPAVDQILAQIGPSQRAVRGLFAGGTLAQEAAAAIAQSLGADAGSVAGRAAGEVLRLGQHQILDLGDDVYTRGRPHPLIDPRLRNGELVAQAEAGDVALFLLDVVLGTGAHLDPAGALAPALDAARAATHAAGDRLQVLASVCGTDDDPQSYDRQRAALEAQGVLVAPSSSAAATIAGRMAARLAEAGR
jgi:succinyl-CoA synthetase alpha subunit